MNKITETQSEFTQLKRLAAQRQLYTDAKNVQKIQGGINILCPLILAICVNYLDMPRVYAVSYGIIMTLLNILCFTPRQEYLQKKAAGIQELFDCDVLKLDWREMVAGPQLGVEVVEKYALKHKRKDPDYLKLKDWYAKDIRKLPLHIARIACQRSNCLWDAGLRFRYKKLIRGILIVLTILTIFIGIKGGFSVDKFILVVVAPLTPTFIIGIQQYKGHTESATRIDKLRKSAVELWEKALEGITPEELTSASRNLQDTIYNHRRKSHLILNIFYNRFREKDEELMNKTVGELVKDAMKSTPS